MYPASRYSAAASWQKKRRNGLICGGSCTCGACVDIQDLLTHHESTNTTKLHGELDAGTIPEAGSQALGENNALDCGGKCIDAGRHRLRDSHGTPPIVLGCSWKRSDAGIS